MKLLIDSGANPHIVNLVNMNHFLMMIKFNSQFLKDKQTAYMIALEKRHYECARLLNEYSDNLSELANLADASSNGMSKLFYFLFNKNLSILF
jgi:hypothetical protein